MATEPVKKAYLSLKERGVKTRFITEITRENLGHCKELMKIVVELRHLDGVKGNFGVGEVDYMASASQLESAPLAQLIHSTAKAVIEQQRYIFETLWKKSIPAKQRIREIEEGVRSEVIETLENPKEIENRMFELLDSARNEVLIIFASANAFCRQKNRGISFLTSNVLKKRPLKVRIMTPADEDVKAIAATLRNEWQTLLDIRFIEGPAQTTMSLLVVDRAFSMAVELRDDSRGSSQEAIGLATYSNSKPTVLSYVSIFESLWSQTELYEQIRLLYEKLQMHDRMQNEFINIAAHELRNPIQPIVGLAEILREQLAGNSEHATMLDAILRSANRLKNLQEDILEVTRIESNLLRLELTDFNLEQAICETIDNFEQQMKSNHKSKDVKLTYEGKDVKNVIVSADRGRISQVLWNLLDNALKFTMEGRISVRVHISKDHAAVISVADTGEGIDTEIFPRLFTKFATKSQKGTGLGLYISKSIIEAHGGRIWAENNDNGTSLSGATFCFTLPLKKLKK